MKRVHVLSTVVAAAVSCGVLCERAQGQAEIEVLIWDSGGAGFAIGAAFALGYTYQSVAIESRFIEKMQQQSWDLVVWELPRVTHTDPRTALQLLDDHIAAGGRAIVNYNNLDAWPELQRLMGVDATVSFDPARDILRTSPPHQTFLGVGPGMGVIWDPYTDSGDELTPSPAGVVIGEFRNGTAAMVLANEARSIVNGFDWESMTPNNASVLELQMQYILSCKADLDQSTEAGVLDIFDFLAFQNLFVQQSAHANFAFDANFDIFDFLAFQRAFMSGCD